MLSLLLVLPLLWVSSHAFVVTSSVPAAVSVAVGKLWCFHSCPERGEHPSERAASENHVVPLVGVAAYFASVWTFLMSVQAPVVTNSYTAAKAVGWLSDLHRVLVILLCQRNDERHKWAERNVKDGLRTRHKHPRAATLSSRSFSLGDSCDLQTGGQSLLCQPFPPPLARSPAWAVLRKL